MTQQQTLLTVEDFYRLYSGKEGHYELVEGEVVKMAPPGFQHGEIALKIGSLLLAHAQQHRLGRVGVEAGFILGPGTVRGPDVAFVRQERIPAGGGPQAFFNGPPDLAVEVVSPSDTAAQIEMKVHDYLRSGVAQVWVAYPEGKRVHVYTKDGKALRYESGDALPGGDLLPGFSVAVREIFEA
ncbi:MAG: Uma2 family endonuclease [Chloroflexi bacterium]|nr:Uma2 family endonuclease [Chloroflexota bacterium]